MGKATYQFLVLAALFFATWFLLGRVNYVKRLHLEQINEKTEKKIGDLIIKTVYAQQTVIENDSLSSLMDKLKTNLCGDSTEASKIRIIVVDAAEVNAFSLPGNNIVVNNALIAHCDSPAQLAGVLAHELAHLRLHHVMKKLGNEIGISILLAVASNGNAQVIREIIRKLSSTAFEREMESDADDAALTYLEKAHIDPAGLPDFLEKLAELKADVHGAPEWISTHPDIQKRIRTLRSKIQDHKGSYVNVLTEEEWIYLKDNCEIGPRAEDTN